MGHLSRSGLKVVRSVRGRGTKSSWAPARRGARRHQVKYAQWRKIEVEFYKFSVAIKSQRKEIIKKLPPNSRYDPADLLSDRWGSMSK